MTEDQDTTIDAIQQARDLIIAYLRKHQQECPKPNSCLERANILAYLAHCMGCTEFDLRHFPAVFVDYEVTCQKHGDHASHGI